MRPLIAAAVMTILAATSAQATSSLSFEGQGYLVDIVVGDASTPIIASLGVAQPASRQIVSLPMHLVRVEIFDSRQKVLLLRFSNRGDATLPESFLLTVKGDVGTLKIGGKPVAGRFDWGM
jgi:hypothetical protein